MGFTDDLWTVLLSDDQEELDQAMERIAQNEVASKIAETAFPIPPPTSRQDDPAAATSDVRIGDNTNNATTSDSNNKNIETHQNPNDD